MEEGGTLVFQFAKDKGYKDKAFFTEQRLRLGYAVQANLTDIALGAFFDRLENGKLIEEKSSYIVDFSGFCTIFAPT